MSNGDLISRSALIGKMGAIHDSMIRAYGVDDGYCTGFEKAMEYVENAPAVDAVEVVHGRWICGYVCSECEHDLSSWADAYYETPYCPNCGAKMDGDRNGNS